MATTSPANYGISNVYSELVEEWNNSLRQQSMQFESFTRIHTDNVAQIRRWNDLPIGRMPTRTDQTANFQTQVIGATGVNSYAPLNKGLTVKINNFDVIHNPQIVQQKLAALQSSVISTSNELVFGKLATAFTDTYDAGHGGNEALIGTQHRFANGFDGVLDEAQSNKLTSALSYSSLSSAVSLLQKFKDQSGTPYGFGMNDLVLIVPSDLYSTAINLVGSPQLLTGSDVTIGGTNPYGGGQISVVATPYLSDTNDWFLCETSAGGHTPVNFWTSGLPQLVVTEDEANLQTVITASAYMNAWVDGPAAGIVGSTLA